MELYGPGGYDEYGQLGINPGWTSVQSLINLGAQQFTVSPSAGTGGSISPATALTVLARTTTSFTVTPDAGYAIDSVPGCAGSLSGNTYRTCFITADCTVTASFALPTYQLSIKGTGMGSGTISISTGENCTGDCLYSYTKGTTVYLTPTLVINSTFDGWTGCAKCR